MMDDKEQKEAEASILKDMQATAARMRELGIRRINPISASSARYPPSPKTEFSAVFDEIW